MHSCLYEGRLRHERRAGAPHRFEYPLFLAWLDLAEIDPLYDAGLLAPGGWGGAVFCRSDHHGPADRPLRECVLDEVERAAGIRPAGPVRMLTLLRQYGYYFAPLTLYYCYSGGATNDGEAEVAAIVAEVSNTPWRERHLYVLAEHNAAAEARGGVRRFEHRKEFHVSPFFSLAMTYEWRCTAPRERLGVQIVNRTGAVQSEQASEASTGERGSEQAGEVAFVASLQLARRELNRANLDRLLWTYPAMTPRITALIYYEAFWLWWKGNRYVPHPSAGAAAEEARSAVPTAQTLQVF